MLNPDGGVWGLVAPTMEVARLGPNLLSPLANTVLVVAAVVGVGWSLYKIARKIDRYAEYLDKQMTPNGGGSLRDLVDSQALSIAEVKDEIGELRAIVVGLRTESRIHNVETKEQAP